MEPATGPDSAPAEVTAAADIGTRPVDAIEATRDELRQRARAAVGVTGETASPPLWRAIRACGVGWYPMVAVGILQIVEQFQGYAFFVLGPEISQALGISAGGLAGLVSLKVVANSVSELPMARLVQARPRRGLVALTTAFAWSVITLFTGFVINAAGMLLVLVADGLSTGSVDAIHQPLIVDSYPPGVRVRALSFYRGMDAAGNMIAPLMVAALTAVAAFTWRGVFLVMGLVSVGATLICVRLRDPGYGRWDTDRVVEAVRGRWGGDGRGATTRAELGFFEIVRRLLAIATLRRVLVAQAVLGMFIIPFYTYLFFYLAERWSMGPGARGLFYAAMPLFSFVALGILGRRGDALYRADPANVVRLGAAVLVGAVVAVCLAVATPVFGLMVVLFGINAGLLGALTPILSVTIFSIVPPNMRPHAGALGGLALAAVGGLGGLVLLGGIDRRFGVGGAIASLAIPGILAAAILLSARRTVNGDLDRMLDEVVEHEEIRLLTARGERLPLLACRRIDFCYGPVQVLFGVSFAVEDGEMVALLGTNGAGKSTLLRVIAGLGLPSRGSVRLDGADITFVDTERRLRKGISIIEGGRAVFPPLTVVENLRMFAYSHGRRHAEVERGIEDSFEAFPSLAARRGQPASTLSGGEQQMLALAKALIVKPRLLLVDELSLGLAPGVVESLLDMIRRINAAGTAVVLVEQSVNVALRLVEHAYFMEKGEIRFDGRAQELLVHDELLRSVFLGGAARGLLG
jgi:ABC-type branched-subunit amino acid transport system ATPase component/sugar phosphate permease